jgi:hypothetical protein
MGPDADNFQFAVITEFSDNGDHLGCAYVEPYD